MQPHYFVALPLASEIKKELAEWTKKMKADYPFSSWVFEEDYHITLCFLGAATENQLERLRLELTNTSQSVEGFSLQIDHLGIFGQQKQPRIFWAGLADQPALFKLQAKTAQACNNAGFTLEQRSYRPHITIARKWTGTKPFHLPVLPDDLLGSRLSWAAESVNLFQTHSERLPRYEPIFKCKLEG